MTAAPTSSASPVIFLNGRNGRTGEELVKVPPNRLIGTLGFRALEEACSEPRVLRRG